ncbi:DNA topoisomerase IV subunit A [Candidatus Vallotia tarda]|uniref:DNA topoisomerase 4 subunit A n=1 Tax=Candidatus Vallotiella hemipterorum TaxID=1177213 RepID=A0A916JRM6_9BURK|nr:DNA topoisomerase IV subunit A [Candidatus Vallotia tarda]CAG7598046.1 DNA topoisomerase 4 subunit A [Candidatus Vallotia tarda]
MSKKLELDTSISSDVKYLTLGDYAEHAYLNYAVSVVKSRALPNVTDGQKPVQRRILYAMHEMGLTANAKPVKSARVIGDVLGKYHPHSDSAAYDALVRLAQDFSMRYPLIDGEGNFGSRDGDCPAAMRYTEAKLTPIAHLLLDEIDEGTIKFIPNYDGSFKEPVSLPVRLPFVLLNGASGIAVGMATEIPSHNLYEVAQAAIQLICNPNLNHIDLLERMPGPDFSGGGQIISSPEEIFLLYKSGRGSLRVRARWEIEELLARGQWQLVIKELPPGTSSQKLLEEIEELTNPKFKVHKKTLTPEQLRSKRSLLKLLHTVRDESGRDAPVRLVFEPKSSRIDQADFINTLLTYTSLESSLPINLVMIGTNGRPQQKGLIEILREWIGYRFEIVARRTQFKLSKVQDRICILEGRMTVFLNLDAVMGVIRSLDEPQATLVATFGLSNQQVDDILNIRVRQLARLEKNKIEKELSELYSEKTQLEELLGSDVTMKQLIIKEIRADAKQFGDTRRTLIQQDKHAICEERIVDEPVTVIVLQCGWVYTLKGHGLDKEDFTFKAGDSLYSAFQCQTIDILVVLGSNGRVYSVPVASLPSGRGDGVPVTSLIKLEAGTHLLHYFAAPLEQLLLLASSNGFGFIARVADMVSRMKTGKLFMTTTAGSKPLAPMPVCPDTLQIACLALCPKGETRLLVFSLNEIKTLSNGGRGTALLAEDDNVRLLQVLGISQTGLMLSGVSRSGVPRQKRLVGNTLAPYVSMRADHGKILAVKFKVLGIFSV